MRYAQISSGKKLHIVAEAGEEYRGQVIRKGFLSNPLCGQRKHPNGYRMTINVPLAHACKKCVRIANLRGD
jgi:hypothetical protein